MSVFEVDDEDIERLDEKQLVLLLNQLLSRECSSNGVPVGSISIPHRIHDSDGGFDASVIWNNHLDRTDFLPSQNNHFQVKSGELGPKKFADDLLDSTGKKFKPLIEEALNNKENIIFFYGKTCNTQKRKRIKKRLQEAMIICGRSESDADLIDMYGSDKMRFPLYFVFQGVVFILPVFSAVERWSSRS